MTKITTITDSEILLKLEETAQKCCIKLSFAHKMFYIKLLHYCEREGMFDEDSNQYFVELSVNSFVEFFSLSHTSVVQSLKLLSDCGIIRREKNKRDFRKISQNSYVKNGAYRTYIERSFTIMLNNLDVFDVDEQEVINRTVQKEDIRTFSKSELIQKLDFVLAISNDDDILSLYNGLKSKLSKLSDEEWYHIRSLLPYDLIYSDDDKPEE